MIEIKGLNHGLILNALELIVPFCAGLSGNPSPEKLSGFLTIFDADKGRGVVTMPFGEIPADKLDKYFSISQEKAGRLYDHPENRSSWQTRDPDNNLWGGAIRVQNHIFSFSGLPELLDEALMLELTTRFGWLDYPDALEIAHLSNNPFFDLLSDAVDAA
jgi:hypothetical protein